eukprot:12875800-Heterocapsa_arctica.AAC.1
MSLYRLQASHGGFTLALLLPLELTLALALALADRRPRRHWQGIGVRRDVLPSCHLVHQADLHGRRLLVPLAIEDCSSIKESSNCRTQVVVVSDVNQDHAEELADC